MAGQISLAPLNASNAQVNESGVTRDAFWWRSTYAASWIALRIELRLLFAKRAMAAAKMGKAGDMLGFVYRRLALTRRNGGAFVRRFLIASVLK